MKKTSKLLGAVALSAAMAMGCAVPAFAETDPVETGQPDVTTDTNNVKSYDLKGNKDLRPIDDTDNASSIVTVSTYTSQISVTIPLTLPLAVDTAGGYGITPTGYYIENGSSLPIEITKANYGIHADSKAEWNFGLGEFSVGDSALRISGDPDNPKGSGAAKTINPKKGTIYMTLEPKSGDPLVLSAKLDAGIDAATGQLTSAMTQGIDGKTYNTLSQDLGWELAAAGETDAKLAIDVNATSSVLSETVDPTTPENFASIIYTVNLASV